MTQKIENKPKGIGGFLLLFVIVIILSGLFNLAGFIGVLIQDKISIYSIAGIIGAVFFLLLTTLSLLTANSLIRIKANAVSLGKKYCILMIIFNLIGFIISATYSQTSQPVFLAMLTSISWLLYLNNSKRVKNTFPAEKSYTLDNILFYFLLALPVAIIIIRLLVKLIRKY